MFFITTLFGGLGAIGCSSQLKKVNHIEKRDTTYEVSLDLKGDTAAITPIVNGKANGKFHSYFSKGKVWSTSWYVDGKLEGEQIVYTEDGQVAEINIWKENRLKEQRIYWQAIPYTDRQKFYFLSDTGVYKIKDGKQVYDFSSTPPEGFILEKYENAVPVFFTYKNGKFERYPNPRERK